MSRIAPLSRLRERGWGEGLLPPHPPQIDLHPPRAALLRVVADLEAELPRQRQHRPAFVELPQFGLSFGLAA